MAREFCPHLENYGKMFRGAEEAYRVCVEIMDEVLDGPADHSLLAQLGGALDSWEKQTRILRSTFVSLKDRGHVLLPREGQNDTPVCGHCGFELPRLEFAEFKFHEDGRVEFRGRELDLPAAASA